MKRIHQIYRDLGLPLRKKLAERRGRAKLRVLTVVDTFNRYCPGLDVRGLARRLHGGDGGG